MEVGKEINQKMKLFVEKYGQECLGEIFEILMRIGSISKNPEALKEAFGDIMMNPIFTGEDPVAEEYKIFKEEFPNKKQLENSRVPVLMTPKHYSPMKMLISTSEFSKVPEGSYFAGVYRGMMEDEVCRFPFSRDLEKLKSLAKFNYSYIKLFVYERIDGVPQLI